MLPIAWAYSKSGKPLIETTMECRFKSEILLTPLIKFDNEQFEIVFGSNATGNNYYEYYR